jgi:hypothetical protein
MEAAHHYRGDAIVHQLLVAAGIDVNTVDEWDRTALKHAVYSGTDGIVQQLLDAPGINFNAGDEDGKTTLICAVEKCHMRVVERLLLVPGNDLSCIEAARKPTPGGAQQLSIHQLDKDGKRIRELFPRGREDEDDWEVGGNDVKDKEKWEAEWREVWNLIYNHKMKHKV